MEPPEDARLLQVHLLGSPTVAWSGHPLEIPRRQVRALVYRLAIRLQPVPREHLCLLFWPDTPEIDARRNLSGLVNHLRRALPAPEVLVATEDIVRLDLKRTWSDAQVFAHLCTRPGLPRRADALQQAIDLYHGPLLAGFSLPGCPEYELWATAERQIYERLYLEALASLIEERATRGEYAAAIAGAQRYLATDDLAEDIHRRLIELYAGTGDRTAAIHQFEACATVLDRELGVDPLPETRAAYQAALAGQTTRSRTPAARPTWTRLPGLEAPHVGRDAAMQQLEEAFGRATGGHGQVVLVSGEAGIGKTRLMQEFATRLEDRVLILAGAGHPDTQSMPYQPVIEALRPALANQLLTRPVPTTWLAEASQLMPELRDLYPSLPSPLPGGAGQARARLFEALCQLTRSLAAGLQPVLLCLDDLHWADDTTLDWLAHLGRKLHGNRILVLGTFRSEEASGVATLRSRLARHGTLTELSLERLDLEATLRLLQSLVGAVPIDETWASRLHEATGGNPFFVLEILRAVLESTLGPARRQEPEPVTRFSGADLGAASPPAWPLPHSIEAAVDARVERLSAQGRQMLEASAVLGRTFAFDLVHQTAGRGELEAVDGLDELVARHLLQEQAGEYKFSHDIARAVVYRGLSRQRRRLLHRRAAETLETVRPGDAAGLAGHFELGGEPGRAAHYALQAGLAAKAVYGHTEARIQFERTIALLRTEAEGLRDTDAVAANRRLQIQALYERGWALRLLGDMEAHARDLQEVTRLAELVGDQCTLAHLRWREAYTHRWFCRYAEAREAAEAGLRLRHSPDTCTLLTAYHDEALRVHRPGERCLYEAMCWREAGLAARQMGDYEQAQTALELALDLYMDRAETVYAIHTLGNLATLYWYRGEFEKAMALSRQGLEQCEAAGLDPERRLPLGDLGAAAAHLDETGLAQQCLLESLEIARQIEDRTQEIFCLGHLGWLAIKLKEPAEAVERLQAGLVLAESIRSCTEQSWLLSGLAEACHLSGAGQQARKCAQRALEQATATGQPYAERLARSILDRLDRG